MKYLRLLINLIKLFFVEAFPFMFKEKTQEDMPELDLADNPLYAGELRNRICLCGSGKKNKNCHGRARMVTKKDAAIFQAYIDQDMEKLKELLGFNK